MDLHVLYLRLNLLLHDHRTLQKDLPLLTVLVPAPLDPRNREHPALPVTDIIPITLIQVTTNPARNDPLIVMQVMVKIPDTENDIMEATRKIVIDIIAIPQVVKAVIANELPPNKVSRRRKNDRNPQHQNYLLSRNILPLDRLNYRPSVARQVIDIIEVIAKVDIIDLIAGTSPRRNRKGKEKRRGTREIRVDGVFVMKMI